MKYVYLFNEYKDKNISELFGKKGVYILETVNLGLPVKNGFIITTDACNQFYEENKKINYEILGQINEGINKLEELTKKKFGNIDNPLLISIKCSPKCDVPNIMDSIINIGLTSDIVENISKNTDEFIWIWECYFELIKNYSKIVMGFDLESYGYVKDILNKDKYKLTIEQLRILANKLKEEYKLKTKTTFPDNQVEQLYQVIDAAFNSWNNKRANIYRRDADIPFKSGMAILVQQTALGNINQKSGVGTIFTRDPVTGEVADKFTNKKYFVGKFSKQEGETIVNLNEDIIDDDGELARDFKEIYNELKDIIKILERHYKDMLKIDFVIENNKLYITDVCKGKKSAKASTKIACDIFDEYTLSKENKEIEVREKTVSFDLVFGGFKQKQYEELDSIVKKIKRKKKF